MQGYGWPFEYSGIFMVWVAGYLGHQDLVTFLRKAKTKLLPSRWRTTRREAPESFIILLDNVIEEDDEPKVDKGQRLRTEAQLEAIFSDAGLLVHRRTKRETMPGDFTDVMAWALY